MTDKSSPSLFEMAEESMNLVGGAVTALLPLFVLSVPIVFPLAVFGGVAGRGAGAGDRCGRAAGPAARRRRAALDGRETLIGMTTPHADRLSRRRRSERPLRRTRSPLAAARAAAHSQSPVPRTERSSSCSYSSPSGPPLAFMEARHARRRRPDRDPRGRGRRDRLRPARRGEPADLRRAHALPHPPRADAPRGGRGACRRGLRARHRPARRRVRHQRPGRDQPRHADLRRADGLGPDAVRHRPGEDARCAARTPSRRRT